MKWEARVVLALVALLACRAPSDLPATPPGAIRVTPGSLELSGWVGFPTTASLEVTNTTATALEVEASSSLSELTVDRTFALGPAESRSVAVVFTPSEEGVSTARLQFADVEVEVALTARQPPTCPDADACQHSTFDPQAGGCVVTQLPDDEACVSPRSCFADARCVHGACVGRVTTCDDGNPCTLDVCGESGCGHLDGTAQCPTSANPCEAPVCEPSTGCGLAPVEDGTLCGARTCDEADVCITGRCVRRAAPRSQQCLEVYVGRPAGPGRGDGVGQASRMKGVTSLWWAQQGSVAFSAEHRIRRVTLQGQVTTLAGSIPGLRDGQGAAAEMWWPNIVGETSAGALIVAEDALTEDQSRSGTLRVVSPQGLVTSFVGGGPTSACRPQGEGIGSAACLMSHGRSSLLGAERANYAQEGGPGGPLYRWQRVIPPAAPNEIWVHRVDMNGEVTFLKRGVAARGEYAWCAITCRSPLRVECPSVTPRVVVGDVTRPCTERPLVRSTVGAIGLRTEDGGVDVTVGVGDAEDGPLGIHGLSGGYSLAVASGPTTLAFDALRAHFRVAQDGGIRILAGPKQELVKTDGPRAQSRLAGEAKHLSVLDDGLYFVDADSFAGSSSLRLADSLVVSSPVVPWPPRTLFRGLGQSLLFHDWAPDSAGVFSRYRPADSSFVATSYSGGSDPLSATETPDALFVATTRYLQRHDADGGLGTLWPPPTAQPWRAVLRREDGGVVAIGGCEVFDVQPDAGLATLGVACPPGTVIDPLAFEFSDVGFSEPWTISPAGDLYFFDLRRTFTLRVLRISQQPRRLETILEMDDQPKGLTVDAQGAIYIGTLGGILRAPP